MQDFYLIRHGETDWNIARKLQGHSDIPLNATGLEQAKSLRQRMSQINITKLISSDLERAALTARTAFTLPLLQTANLREVALGDAEGRTKDELIALYGEELWVNWSSINPQYHDLRFPNGESKTEMLERLTQCLHHYLDLYPQDQLAFVSHGLLMRTFTHLLVPDLKETHLIANCGVLKIKRTADKTFVFQKYFDQNSQIIT